MRNPFTRRTPIDTITEEEYTREKALLMTRWEELKKVQETLSTPGWAIIVQRTKETKERRTQALLKTDSIDKMRYFQGEAEGLSSNERLETLVRNEAKEITDGLAALEAKPKREKEE